MPIKTAPLDEAARSVRGELQCAITPLIEVMAQKDARVFDFAENVEEYGRRLVRLGREMQRERTNREAGS